MTRTNQTWRGFFSRTANLDARQEVGSFGHAFGFRKLFAQAGDDAQTILNLAATAETLACTHYYNVLTQGNIALTPDEQNILKSALDAEIDHLVFLNANGATSLATEFYFPQNVYTDREQFSVITETAEQTFVAAYLAAVRRVTELGNPLLAATAAQIAVVEQAHLALIRQIGGRVPNHVSLGQALVFNVSDAVPTLQGFLAGGDGFVETASQFPGEAGIREIIGDVGVIAVRPFTDPNVTATGTAEASATGPCTVTPAGSINVNIRGGAGITNAVTGKLNVGTSVTVTGVATGTDGFQWYAVDGGGFVRSDVVSRSGNCVTLPNVG